MTRFARRAPQHAPALKRAALGPRRSSNLEEAVHVAKAAVDHSVEVDKAKGSIEMDLGKGRDEVLEQVHKAVKVMKDGPGGILGQSRDLAAMLGEGVSGTMSRDGRSVSDRFGARALFHGHFQCHKHCLRQLFWRLLG